jgi:hypothetical protein
MERTKSKFLYLDDNDKTTRDGDVELINHSSKCISIVTDYPNSWKKRSEKIMQEMDQYDGLILDWEFTNLSKEAKEGCENAEDVDFSPEAIAEHIRVNAAQGKIKDIPIIVCSADKNKAFSNLRKKEQSSQDLFDLAFVKEEIFISDIISVEKQLCDLALVYKNLSNTSFSISTLLCLEDSIIEENLDIRFIEKLETLKEEKTSHDLVQFFLREVIERESVLIDKNVVAARLGIDINESSEELEKLLEIIDSSGFKINYKGILSSGWQRYWAFQLENWWKTIKPNFYLQTSKATKRVDFLNEKFKLNLKVAKKIEFCSSDEFWTICYGTKRPLDPLNGFQIGEYPHYPWQNLQYVSAFAELEKINKFSWKINIMDRERYNKFKKIINLNE